MAKRVTGLGRGLEALLPTDDINNRLQQMKNNNSGDAESSHSASDVPENSEQDLPTSQATQKRLGTQLQELPLSAIRISSDQPRKYFNEITISELAQSIFEHGLLQPILVLPLADEELSGDGVKYRIIAGERRFRACQVLKWQRIPAIVKAVSEVEHFELALIENIQREDLSPIDEALAYQHLLRISGLSQQEMAKRLGKGRSALANSLRLLQLPHIVQEGLAQGLIRSGHAKALLMLKDTQALEQSYQRCLDEVWSVRQTERYCQQYGSPQEAVQEVGCPKSPAAAATGEAEPKADGEFRNLLQAEASQPDTDEHLQEKDPKLPQHKTPTSGPHPENAGIRGDAAINIRSRESSLLPHPANTEAISEDDELDVAQSAEPVRKPEYWGVQDMLFRQEELEEHLTRALDLRKLHLKLEGNLNDEACEDSHRLVGSSSMAPARPRKAYLQVEFENREQWEYWLQKLGLDQVLQIPHRKDPQHSSRDTQTSTKTKSGSNGPDGEALFS